MQSRRDTAFMSAKGDSPGPSPSKTALLAPNNLNLEKDA